MRDGLVMNWRVERGLTDPGPVGKTLASFDFDAVPMLSKAQVMALASGDNWIEKGANLFGPPGAGKSPSCRRHRPRFGRKWMARAVHAHQRSCPAPASRVPRTRPRKHAHQARQVSGADPRRHRLYSAEWADSTVQASDPPRHICGARRPTLHLGLIGMNSPKWLGAGDIARLALVRSRRRVDNYKSLNYIHQYTINLISQ
jgi:hypothetical protein